MSHVFISYSHDDYDSKTDTPDNNAIAHYIAGLQRHNVNIWLDRERLKPGDDFPEEIVAAIRSCRALIVFMSPQSAKSWYVAREVTYAIEFGRRIIPILLEGDRWLLLERTQDAKSVDEIVHALRDLPKLFICHAKDVADFASYLADKLQKLAAIIWQPPDKDSFAETVQKENLIMLLVLSPDAITDGSEIVSKWKYFLKNELKILPILRQQTTVPPEIRKIRPYIDFLDQQPDKALGQLAGLLRPMGVILQGVKEEPIPRQPPLRLAGFGMVAEAKQHFWTSGIALDTMTKYVHTLEKIIRGNNLLKVRLLMLPLDITVANETGAWMGINEAEFAKFEHNRYFEMWARCERVWHGRHITRAGRYIAQRVFENQQVLDTLRAIPGNRVEVRTLPHRLSTGHFIVDPDREDSMLTAAPYFYLVDVERELRHNKFTAPTYISKREATEIERWWFEEYVEEFKRLWDNAAKLKLSTLQVRQQMTSGSED